MSVNIHKHEAVYPPAVYSLRRMANQSPVLHGTKGTYELHECQHSPGSSYGDKVVNGLSDSAPGSPGMAEDYRQIVLKLQKELDDSQNKRADLQQIIADLDCQPHSSPSIDDNQYMDASSSNESLGENVKDAHIKHLQRTVTVLQAKLYRTEGWANRMASALKERDKAADDVTRLNNELKSLQIENQNLQQRIETLNSALRETQDNLQQVTNELLSQSYDNQLIGQMREEVQRHRSEIITLKESLTRLNQENKSLKDSGVDLNSQSSVGQMTCSRELEHLHMVVDTLKRTVLEQRRYLLQLKRPGSNKSMLHLMSTSSPAHLMSTSSPAVISPGLTHSSSAAAGANQPLTGSGLSDHSVGLLTQGINPTMTKDYLLETKQPLQRNCSAPTIGQDSMASMRRKLNSHDFNDDVFHLDNLNSSHQVPGQNDGSAATAAPQRTFQADANSLSQNYKEAFRQNVCGDLKNTNNQLPSSSPNGAYVLPKLPQHRTAYSEVLAKKSSPEKLKQEQWGSKSEILARAGTGSSHVPSSIKGAAVAGQMSSANKFCQASPGLDLLKLSSNLSKKVQQEGEFTGKPEGTSVEGQRKQLSNGSTAQIIMQSSTPHYENINRNSPTFQFQTIYHPPASGHELTARVTKNHDSNTSSQHGIPPSVHRQDVVYVNTAQTGNIPKVVPVVSSDSSAARLNADRVCPVCSQDYSHASLEDFQAHVFECFDDENPPETMRPQQESLVRSCPMCPSRFGPETTQLEFEAHVHSHFDDVHTEPFEILQ